MPFLSLVTLIFGLWPWPSKLLRARDQARLPCEFGANPFSGSRHTSYANKRNTDWRRQKQNLPHSSLHAVIIVLCTQYHVRHFQSVFVRSAVVRSCVFSASVVSVHYTPCLKNVPPLACYNFDVHEWILIFFGRNVTNKVGNQKTLYYATSNNLCFCTTWQNEETRKACFTQLDC